MQCQQRISNNFNCSKKARRIRNLVCLLKLSVTHVRKLYVRKKELYVLSLRNIYLHCYANTLIIGLIYELLALQHFSILPSSRRFYSALVSIYKPQNSSNYRAKILHSINQEFVPVVSSCRSKNRSLKRKESARV